MFNGIPVLGQTNATLILTNLQTAQQGLYSVMVANVFGTVTSPSAALTVNPAIILPTIQLIFPQHLANGQFEMTLMAATNQPYLIQVSTNLSSWLDWTNISPASLNTLMIDPEASKYNHRFYRAVGR